MGARGPVISEAYIYYIGLQTTVASKYRIVGLVPRCLAIEAVAMGFLTRQARCTVLLRCRPPAHKISRYLACRGIDGRSK
eukprot:scaffold53665_cov59-Attheya_sp.AAC.3